MPPAVAVHMMGDGGAYLVLVMLFMAVTSTGSAEQIAVSSLISYDVYKTYINPKATGAQLMWVGRCVIVAVGILMGVISIILFEIGLSLGWVRPLALKMVILFCCRYSCHRCCLASRVHMPRLLASTPDDQARHFCARNPEQSAASCFSYGSLVWYCRQSILCT